MNRVVLQGELNSEVKKIIRKYSRIDLFALELNKHIINSWYDVARSNNALSVATHCNVALHTSDSHREWQDLGARVDIKEFLRIRDQPFREIDEMND